MSDADVKHSTLKPSHVSFNMAAVTSIGVGQYNPVIYTGTSGGGANEFAASNDPNNPNSHDLPLGKFNIPAGATVVHAWYTAFHNIGALNTFAWIDLVTTTNSVTLRIAGYRNQQSRLRIQIHVLYSQ